ncbi:MAG: hypothetical protein QOF71_2658 [Candidatus Eremiobacteraeota bacterium]|nr:hypothetical protein [Candidatus Eremiobacteraeota bacterium]
MSLRSDSAGSAIPGRLPSGTVTFTFTDIEGSTQRWDQDRQAMQDAVRRHDRVLRDSITAHGGYVFKTIGDAFCAAFSRAEDALAAMLDAQRGLAAEDFSAVGGVRARAAIHTGTADERDGDYFGPAVNRVARLLAIGHGGQVLVSETTADLLGDDLPPQVSLRHLGQHRLKDLSRAEQVYELAAPDLPYGFPELRSLDALPNNLPRQLTSFVGRDTVLADVRALIEKSALVTIVGPGGAGKTRCAIQAGAELLDGAGDGVWLVELAPISDATLVASTIAKALNLEQAPTSSALDTVITFLRRKRLLLIVDNVEHVIDEARTVVSAILHRCPDVRLLVTSREALNIAGEECYRMPSLEVPATSAVTVDDCARYGAFVLFGDRAQSVEKRFALTDDNAPFVAEICRRLDGMPLAIELAAARVKILSPQQLMEMLDERFRVLTGGDRSALPRQQTMRALIDWSYDLLSEQEQTLFQRLSIFAGAFTLDMATAVCVDDAIDALAVLDLLTSLVAKSLVQADVADSGTCYVLLESTRQYAREKLQDSGEYAAIARAHARAYLELERQLERSWAVTPAQEWLARVEPNLENWRAALEWALESRGDVRIGQELAALSGVTFARRLAEARRWVSAAQETVDADTPPIVAVRLDLAQAFIDWRFQQHKSSYAAAQRALARLRELDTEPIRTAHALRISGNALLLMGRVAEGEPLLQEALTISRALGARKFTGWILESLALARYLSGDLAGGRVLFDETVAIATDTNHWQLAATSSLSRAEAEFRGGDTDTALRLAGDALDAYRGGKDRPNAAATESSIAAYLAALGRYDEAVTYARDALAPLRESHREVAFAFALQHLAAIAALRPADDAERARDDRERAAGLAGYVDARLDALEAQRDFIDQEEYDKIIPALRVALGESRLAQLMNGGRSWGEDHAVAQAALL